MATRAITRYRTRTVRTRRTRSRETGGRKLPLAVIAGLAPGVIGALEGIGSGALPPQDIFKRLIYFYVPYDPWQKRFSWYGLSQGLYPLLFGLAIHWGANRIGVNRMFRSLPIEI